MPKVFLSASAVGPGRHAGQTRVLSSGSRAAQPPMSRLRGRLVGEFGRFPASQQTVPALRGKADTDEVDFDVTRHVVNTVGATSYATPYPAGPK
jgi:hypothetical protein